MSDQRERLCNCLDNECCPALPPGWECRKAASSSKREVSDVDELLEDPHGAMAEIERLARERSALATESQQWAARYEKASRLLTDILFHLPPEAIHLEDGRVMVFVDPDPTRTLRLIQSALQRAFDQARSEDEATDDRVAILTAAALAHRACCGTEHNPEQGKLHGCCVVCGVPWPCDTAKQFLRPSSDEKAIVPRCEYGGSYGRCELEEGHDGLHKLTMHPAAI